MSSNSKITLSEDIKTEAFRTLIDVDLPKLQEILKNFGTNMLQALPEGLFVGAFLLGLITHNMALMMLTLAMIIFRYAGIGIGALLKNTLSSIVPLNGGPSRCSFPQVSLSAVNGINSTMRESALPTQPLFFVVAVIFFCVANIYKFKNELHVLKRDDVLPVSGVFGLLIIAIYMIWRMKNECDSKEVILVSVVAAAFVAYIVSGIFETTFGRYSINMLNIPLLSEEKILVENVTTCSQPNLMGV